MESEQELEWVEAQKIPISRDLVAKAKQQLLFLAEIDRNRSLYGGAVLERANSRYKHCWLPLLAKHAESPITQDPFVVPLDCEWIWHCHRLNPVRYKKDCMELYGRILDDRNVVSSIQTSSKEESERIWKYMYPSEPYELDLENNDDSTKSFDGNLLRVPATTTKYDLISAVKRQATFFYQVSRPYWNDDTFLQGALSRYKGFLHLIKRNKERSLNQFCVPTYDIDLIWHSHQLHPASYCKDLEASMGKVLEHDDTDSDRSKGQKLDTGFSETTKQWENTFGTRYWKAGAMHRGNPPNPLTVDRYKTDAMHNDLVPLNKNQNLIQLPQKMLVEVMLEVVDVRDLPSGHKGKLVVSISKKQQDMFFYTKKQLSISSMSKEKQVAFFRCESSGELVLELISWPSFKFRIAMSAKVLGKTSINLEEFQNAASRMPVEKWLDLPSTVNRSKPISLHIGFSLTPPFPAPFELHMVSATRPFIGTYFPFLLPRKFQQIKNWTNVVDEAGNEVISIHVRNLANMKMKNNIKKEVIGTTASGETHLAELKGTSWSMMNSNWVLRRKMIGSKYKNVYELTGDRKVIIFPGRKLEFENRYHGYDKGNCIMTAVEFSPTDPYGKAVALMDLTYGFLEIKEEWLVFHAILAAFVLSNFLDFINGEQIEK